MHGSPVARAASAALVDLVLVLVFVAIGRLSHDEGVGLAGMARTAGPFLLGWLAGWVVVGLVPRTRRHPRGLPAGVLVWVAVVVVGMVVRDAVGQGVQTSFVVVTIVVVGVFLLGWRGVVAVLRRGPRARGERPAPAGV
jgi:biotin transporter BioY